MHHKNIKVIVRKQLKTQFPNWKRLGHKVKQTLVKQVLAEVEATYDFSIPVTTSKEELLGIEEQASYKGIINLQEMARFIDIFHSSSIVRLSGYQRSPLYIKDEELRYVDELLDDRIINRLLAYRGYSPAMREFLPSTLLRAELLKAIRYPEISYRKFCSEEYLGLDRQQNRVFCGLPLNRKEMIDHTRLCQFRRSLSFAQQVNLLVYMLYHCNQSGLLGDTIIHSVDSTELANDCKLPLFSTKINGKNIRIYNDLDCDCGKRRNKRDKSPYVIGYRLHTLSAIDAATGHSVPLASLLAPANHHDSHFLPFLVKLGQAMGIELQLVSADEAYHDKDDSLFQETGVRMVIPPASKVCLPEHVDAQSGSVFCHGGCEVPMRHLGVDDGCHEFKCNATPGECTYSGTCPKYRIIALDSGHFQRVLSSCGQVQEAQNLRKNCERNFNLLKHQTGLETVRVRSQQATLARCTISSMAVLLIKMAGVRQKSSTSGPTQQLLWETKKAV
jgi:hypothetical protein